MATLKTIASTLGVVSMLCVDPDAPTTVKDLASAPVTADLTFDTNTSPPGFSIGSRSRNGFTRNFFKTEPNDIFNFRGIRTGTNKPALPSGSGTLTVLYILAGVSPGANVQFFFDSSHTPIGRDGTTGRLCARVWGSNLSTNAVPNDGTPFSFVLKFRNGGTSEWWHALEGDDFTANGTFVDNGFGSGSGVITAVGGAIGSGNLPHEGHAIITFNTDVDMADLNTINDDYVSALLDLSSGGGGMRRSVARMDGGMRQLTGGMQ